MNKSPCLNCKKRCEACHDDCSKFKEFREPLNKRNKEKLIKADIDCHTFNAMLKNRMSRNLPLK